jgi:ABC-type glycerol-3-phosphate transport system substrate-binding protein
MTFIRISGVAVLSLLGGVQLGAAQEVQNLTLWAASGTNITQSGLIEKFEAKYPQYNVVLTEYPWQVKHDKLVAAMASGEVPDVALAEDQWVGEFVYLDGLEPLDDFKAAVGYKDEDFYPGFWSYFTAEDGKTYGAPGWAESRALFWRTDLFEKAGLTRAPETLDELVEYGKKLTDGEHQFGLADQSGDLDLHFFSWLLYSFGGDVYDEAKTKCTLTEPKAMAAINFYKGLYDANVIPNDPAKRVDTSQGFEQGYYAMAESGPWWLELLHREAPQIDGKWAVAPLPFAEANISYGHPQPWIIPRGSKNIEGAQAWIEFMLEPENGVDWFFSSGQIPPTKAALDDPRLADNPNVRVLVEAVLNGVNSVHGVPNGHAITIEIGKMAANIKDGTQTPEEAAAATCQRIDRLLRG